MKLGMLTACLPGLTLEQVSDFAAGAGLEALELAAWPREGERPFTATHLDATNLSPHDADVTVAMLAAKGLTISGLAYYDNNLHPDLAERQAVNDHVIACVDAAALLGCPVVGTFVGRDPTRTVAENLRQAERIFPRLVEHGGERGVHIVIENCVMEGWHPDGYPGNLAFYNNALSWTIANGRPSLEVLKVEIALGRWLQRTSRKSGRQRIPLRDLMSRAQARKREIMDEYPRGHPQHRGAAKAEDMVADEFQPGSGISSKPRFIEVMRRPSKWNRK